MQVPARHGSYCKLVPPPPLMLKPTPDTENPPPPPPVVAPPETTVPPWAKTTKRAAIKTITHLRSWVEFVIFVSTPRKAHHAIRCPLWPRSRGTRNALSLAEGGSR